MIRTADLEDVDAVVDVAIAARMFTADDRPFLSATLAESLTEHIDEHYLVIDDTPDGRLRGAAYLRPKEGPDRVWDLTMIAVEPAIQGKGVGRKLMRHIEDDLRFRDQRLLLIETSSTGQYDRTRDFYRKLNYDEVAIVRDYWTDGDDLILFRKNLQGTGFESEFTQPAT